MTKFVVALLFCALILIGGCGRTDESSPGGETSDTTRHAVGVAEVGSVTAEVQAMAQQLLGSGAEVVAFGDLAGNGRRQVLVINRSAAKQKDALGVVFSRAAVLEQRGSNWDEVLLCDEYLKNPNGFLVGTPMAQVTAWRLRFGSHTASKQVGEFDFTPIQQDGTGPLPTIVVRWNPKADRYQSFDAGKTDRATGGSQAGGFLRELMSLEPPRSELR